MTGDVVPTSEIRAALGRITRRFDEGDTDPVVFGSHRRPQAVLVPIATWHKLLERAEDELDFDLARRRSTGLHSWLDEQELATAVQQAADRATPRKPA